MKPKPKMQYKETESTREKIGLYTKMQEGSISSRDLVRLSLLTNMISKEQYEDFLQIEKSLEDF